MKVECPNCSARLDIPEERLPVGKKVSVVCPKCNTKFPVFAPGPKITQEPDKIEERPQEVQAPEAPSLFQELPAAPPTAKEYELAMYEEGARHAMILCADGEVSGALLDAMAQMGYKAYMEEDLDLAIGRIKLYKFDLIVIEDGFRGYGIVENPLMQFINSQSMTVRRTMNIVAVSDKVRTMDPMWAYALSVELVVNTRDISNLPSYLEKVLSSKQAFYKAFLETLAEMGKI